MITRSNWIRALLITLGALAAVGESTPTHATDRSEMVALDPQKMKFEPIPDMPSCASGAVLRGNPRTGPAWVMLKLASGCRVPWHWHTPKEDLLIISGQGTLAMKDGPPLKFVPGAWASLPGHHVHQASCVRACLIFTIADGSFDIHYVDADGEEIPADQALKQPAKTKGTKK